MVNGLEITRLCSAGLSFLALYTLLLISLFYWLDQKTPEGAVSIPQFNPCLELLIPMVSFFILRLSIWCFVVIYQSQSQFLLL